MPKRIPRGFGKRTPEEELAFKLNLLENNPTELYLMVVRNECTLEDLAKLYLKVQGDWYMEEFAEQFAKLILRDEAAVNREVFRILDEVAQLRDANLEAEYIDAMIWAEIEAAYEEEYGMSLDEEVQMAEQIYEYLEL